LAVPLPPGQTFSSDKCPAKDVSTPWIEHCEPSAAVFSLSGNYFRDCEADARGDRMGGAVLVWKEGSVCTVAECVFESCWAERGGAIAACAYEAEVRDHQGSDFVPVGRLTLLRCCALRCAADWGAFFLTYAGTTVMTSLQATACSAEQAGLGFVLRDDESRDAPLASLTTANFTGRETYGVTFEEVHVMPISWVLFGGASNALFGEDSAGCLHFDGCFSASVSGCAFVDAVMALAVGARGALTVSECYFRNTAIIDPFGAREEWEDPPGPITVRNLFLSGVTIPGGVSDSGRHTSTNVAISPGVAANILECAFNRWSASIGVTPPPDPTAAGTPDPKCPTPGQPSSDTCRPNERVVSLSSNHFSDCRTSGWGGAVNVQIADTDFTASECVFSRCSAQSGGALSILGQAVYGAMRLADAGLTANSVALTRSCTLDCEASRAPFLCATTRIGSLSSQVVTGCKADDAQLAVVTGDAVNLILADSNVTKDETTSGFIFFSLANPMISWVLFDRLQEALGGSTSFGCFWLEQSEPVTSAAARFWTHVWPSTTSIQARTRCRSPVPTSRTRRSSRLTSCRSPSGTCFCPGWASLTGCRTVEDTRLATSRSK
jgi:hypothetical protein